LHIANDLIPGIDKLCVIQRAYAGKTAIQGLLFFENRITLSPASPCLKQPEKVKLQKKRLEYLDVAKGIAIFPVVMGPEGPRS